MTGDNVAIGVFCVGLIAAVVVGVFEGIAAKEVLDRLEDLCPFVGEQFTQEDRNKMAAYKTSEGYERALKEWKEKCRID